MSDQTPESASGALPLPETPNLEWLRKRAKHRLDELRESNPGAQLADAQFDLAKQYGFPSWRALKSHVDSLTIDGQLFEAARKGDLEQLAALLDEHPDKLYVRAKPYEHTLLHMAAQNGHLDVVRRLADAGGDVIGEGDDHALGMIGWATGWEGCDDATHRAIADFLI